MDTQHDLWMPCRLYLRSIGKNPRKEVSDVAALFPDLAADLAPMHLIPPGQLFSTALRMSSGLLSTLHLLFGFFYTFNGRARGDSILQNRLRFLTFLFGFLQKLSFFRGTAFLR